MPRRKRADDFVLDTLRSIASDRKVSTYYRLISAIILGNVAGTFKECGNIPVELPRLYAKKLPEPDVEKVPTQDVTLSPEVEKQLSEFSKKHGGANGIPASPTSNG